MGGVQRVMRCYVCGGRGKKKRQVCGAGSCLSLDWDCGVGCKISVGMVVVWMGAYDDVVIYIHQCIVDYIMYKQITIIEFTGGICC